MEQRPDDDLPYDPPAWLQAHFEAISSALPDYDVDSDATEYAQHFARATAELGAAYFDLYTHDPAGAVVRLPEYLARFRGINQDPRFQAGILNPIVPEQFGLIANIATLRYGESGPDQQRNTLKAIGGALITHNTLKIPFYTAELRDPSFVRDLCAHWDIYQPHIRNYTSMAEHADWPTIQAAMANHRVNPLMLALAVPLPSTPPETRAQFRQEYETVADQAVDVAAAIVLSRGASDEVSRDIVGPDRFPMSWEESIYHNLDHYAEEYRPLILAKIAAGAGAAAHVTELAHPRLIEKLQSADFSFDADGALHRIPRAS
jgi:hypothetical protein